MNEGKKAILFFLNSVSGILLLLNGVLISENKRNIFIDLFTIVLTIASVIGLSIAYQQNGK